MTSQTQNSSADPAVLASPAVQRAFATVRTAVALHGALAVATLAAVAAVAATGHQANTFMWVRAVLLPLVAVLLHRQATAAATGSRRAFDRLRTVTLVMPIAVVAVDLIPGICPLWYTAAQTATVLPALCATLLTRTPPLRTTHSTPR
ncbi:hypothetical protein ACFV4P_24685 [Kitasatospora sp. NPDC059795]|uniref:hypothetical protein n=1 Tax=Kitasatospora sp. NPDC059795 TaxID=3346949 RepID=UPI003660DF3D